MAIQTVGESDLTIKAFDLNRFMKMTRGESPGVQETIEGFLTVLGYDISRGVAVIASGYGPMG